MKLIKVKKPALLEALKRNRDIHSKEYEEALIDFRKKCVAVLEAELLKTNRTDTLSVNITAPINAIDNYNEAIGMLEFHCEDIIELDNNEYKRYILNEWQWTGLFKTLAASYK